MSHPADDQTEHPPVRFGPDGLVPAVIQDAASGVVLMLGYMNAEALAATRTTGRVHFWSRSRQTLWRKGETSGHEQLVEGLYVNCEQNSLLIAVRQVGACCHDGYPTCFYRRLEPDNRLTVVQERAFDPAAVYGTGGDTSAGGLARATRLHLGAYRVLRDRDLTAVSATAARLRSPEDRVSARVAEELRELAGVLEGSHRHGARVDDLLLEGSQVLYWLTLAALRAGATWETLRPDRALATTAAGLDAATAARLLRAEAERWATAPPAGPAAIPACHAALALLAQAVAAGRVAPLALVERDLTELRDKPYLAGYFAAAAEPKP